MAIPKSHRRSKQPSHKFRSKKNLGVSKQAKAKKSKKSKKKTLQPDVENRIDDAGDAEISANDDQNVDGGSRIEGPLSAAQQLAFFLGELQSATGVQLSSLELESIKDTCILELSQGLDQDANTIGTHIKAAFGPSWKEVLCDKQLQEGKIEPGSPAVLVISSSALRSLEVLRGLRLFTKECPAAKLFSKHMKVKDQASSLKHRTNVAAGTPNRIKKLIDDEVLGLSRLVVVVLDMHLDVKGYSLLTLPQVRTEFWDLYRTYFHKRLIKGDLRVCLYGQSLVGSAKRRKSKPRDE